MRLATWNCHHGSVTDRLRDLRQIPEFTPDVVALQECSRPDLPEREVNWRGSYEHKGLAVSVVGEGWAGNAIPLPPDAPMSVLPIWVTGPVNFTVVGVWTHEVPSYTQDLLKGLVAIKPLLPAGPLVVMGDFNNHPRWDNPATPMRNHATIVRTLEDEFGLVSAYHHFHGIEHGRDRNPTHYFMFDEARPFHIDYVFAPKEWAEQIARVEVGSFEDWRSSDHRPMLVQVDVP